MVKDCKTSKINETGNSMPNESKKKVKKHSAKIKNRSKNSPIELYAKLAINQKNEIDKANRNIKAEAVIASPKVSFASKVRAMSSSVKSPRVEEQMSRHLQRQSVVSPNPPVQNATKASQNKVYSNENLTICSPKQKISENLIKAQNISSFSVVSPKKSDFFKSVTALRQFSLGSLERDSPLKILAMRAKETNKRDLECLVTWKNKQQTLQDSVVEGKELRVKYPQLLLDFYEDRLKFI